MAEIRVSLRAAAPAFQPKTTASTGTANRRLLADLDALQRDPVPLIAALPLEADITTWHLNLQGPGGLFHIELRFPDSYPRKSPSASLYTPLPHPHVHGSKICLDLLSDYNSYFAAGDPGAEGVSSGWSAAYTVETILLQLQTFLMELDESEGVPLEEYLMRVDLFLSRRYLTKIPRCIIDARVFNCPKCPHRGTEAPWPPLPKLRRELSQSGGFTEQEATASELVCWYTKQSYKKQILGFPVHVPLRRDGNKDMKSMECAVDLLSYQAFKEGARQDPLGTQKMYDGWIPIWIDKQHGSDSRVLLKKQLAVLAEKPSAPDKFRWEWAVDIIPKLMNSMVVNFMKATLHASTKALDGYCALHRLLISFAEEYPALTDHVNQCITDFVRDERMRTKKVVPALVSKFTWNDVKEAYINESLIRNVRWAAQAEPALGSDTPDPVLDPQRPDRTFKHNQVSFRLLIYHVYFLERIARPEGRSLAQVSTDYDLRLGRASSEQKEQFQALVKDVLESVVSFDELFRRVGLKPLGSPMLVHKLRSCVSISLQRGYHHLGQGTPEGKGGNNKDNGRSPRKADGRSSGKNHCSDDRGGRGNRRQNLTRSLPTSSQTTTPLSSPLPSPAPSPPPAPVNAWATRALHRQMSISKDEVSKQP